jgi:hypothetical protein
LERLVRDAGASCYLPSTEDDGPLVQAVTSMLEHAPMQPAGAASADLVTQFEPPLLIRPGNKGMRRRNG